jgi:AAA domain/Primase C terminal 2 (PriCT-2)
MSVFREFPEADYTVYPETWDREKRPRKIRVTFFATYAATAKTEKNIDLAELQSIIFHATAATKADLPWLKLAAFGDKRSKNNSFRHDANVVSISGIELDYDLGEVSFDAASNKLKEARLTAILYTSPSYTVPKPKWRVLLPTSQDLPPTERTKLAARVNGLFGGTFAGESFTLSQAYYYGSVASNPEHRVDCFTGDYVDLRDDLDAGAIGTERDRTAHSAGENPEAHPSLIAAALAVIPNDDLPWDEWNRIGMATWRASGGSAHGFVAFDHWSKKSDKYDAATTSERWNSYHRSPPTEIGFGTLDYLASAANPCWRDELDAKVEAELEEANRNAALLEGSSPESEKVEAEPSTEDQSLRHGEQQQQQPPNDPETMRLNQIRDQVAMVRVAEVEAKKVEWIWPQRIPMGKLTTVAGMPDVNKSTFTLYLAAQITTGGPWPCNEGIAPLGSVIVLTAEDDIADTVRPRLEVAGADLNRVHIIKAVKTDEGVRGFNLISDVLRLELVIKHIGDVKMVIIDPISAYMGKPGKMDSHRSTDVRATLAPLQELAARHKVAVVAIDHLNKSGGTTALLRVLNSIAFVAAARAVYFIMRDDDDADRRLLLAAKNNLGRIRTGLAFKVIEKLAPPPVFEAYPAIKWEDEAVDMTADEALAARHDGRASEKLEEAKALLRELLTHGPAKKTDIEAKARERQIGPKSLRNAQTALGIVASQADRAWWWRMPNQEPPM